MALSYKTRRRLSLVALLVWLPLYIALVLWVISLFDRPSIWLEFGIYAGLGFLWMLPLRAIFLGVGQADPDAPKAGARDE